MAEETKGTDNAQAPAPSETETTGAGTASGQTTQQTPDIVALTARVEAAEKAAKSAAQFAHTRDTEVRNLRQKVQQYEQSSYGRQEEVDEAAVTQQRQQQNDQRIGLIEYKQNHPEWVERRSEMEALIQDPQFAAQFGNDLGNVFTFHSALQFSELNRLRAAAESGKKAQAELDAMKTKQKSAQETLKSHAFVSGMGTSDPPQAIDPAELAKMTPEEMEKKFGKAVLLRGVH